MVDTLGYQRQYSIQESANGKGRFENESILEEFIWDNLNILFNASPLSGRLKSRVASKKAHTV
jgi:hypothetical protein